VNKPAEKKGIKKDKGVRDKGIKGSGTIYLRKPNFGIHS